MSHLMNRFWLHEWTLDTDLTPFHSLGPGARPLFPGSTIEGAQVKYGGNYTTTLSCQDDFPDFSSQPFN